MISSGRSCVNMQFDTTWCRCWCLRRFCGICWCGGRNWAVVHGSSKALRTCLHYNHGKGKLSTRTSLGNYKLIPVQARRQKRPGTWNRDRKKRLRTCGSGVCGSANRRLRCTPRSATHCCRLSNVLGRTGHWTPRARSVLIKAAHKQC
jgi:hypothetical protein